MEKVIKSFSILFISLFFVSCSSTNNNIDVEKNKPISYNKTYETYDGYTHMEHTEPMIDYVALSNQAVNVIFKNNKIPEKLIVTDFVDLNSLENRTSMGYILSNSVKNALINTKKIKIIEAELSKNFKMSQNGLRVLTRDINDIKSNNFNVQRAIAGTYTYNESELVIFIKLIDLKSGLIEGSYTKSLPIGLSIQNMLKK